MQFDRKNIPTYINNFKNIGFDEVTFIALLQITFTILFLEASATEKVSNNLHRYSSSAKVQEDIVRVNTVTRLFVEKLENHEDINDTLWFLVEIAGSHLRSSLNPDAKKTVVQEIITAGEESNSDLEQLQEFSKALLDFLEPL